MDLADDITYSVHDVEDFYRAGLIPLHLIVGGDKKELERFLEGTKNRWAKVTLTVEIAKDHLSELKSLMGSSLFSSFKGNVVQKADLRNITSMLIRRYVKAINIVMKDGNYKIEISDQCDSEIRILKQLPYFYVFNHPNLTIQKHGQKEVISYLFKVYLNELYSKKEI
jgi:dGTPase